MRKKNKHYINLLKPVRFGGREKKGGKEVKQLFAKLRICLKVYIFQIFES